MRTYWGLPSHAWGSVEFRHRKIGKLPGENPGVIRDEADILSLEERVLFVEAMSMKTQ